MSKGRHVFKLNDLKRAIKAVTDAGLNVSAVRISPQGDIVVETGKIQAQDSASDLERWIAKRGHHAGAS